MLFVDVDDDRLVGLLAAIGAVAEEDAGAADRQLEALSAHRLDKDAQLKLAAAGDLEAVIIVRGGDADGDLALGLALQPGADDAASALGPCAAGIGGVGARKRQPPHKTT